MMFTPHTHVVTPEMAKRRRYVLSVLPSEEIVGGVMIAGTFAVEIAPVDGASPQDIATFERVRDGVRDGVRDVLHTVRDTGSPIKSRELAPIARRLDDLQRGNGVHLYGALRNRDDRPGRLIFLVALAPGLHESVTVYR